MIIIIAYTPHVLFQRPCASAKKRKQQPLTPSVPACCFLYTKATFVSFVRFIHIYSHIQYIIYNTLHIIIHHTNRLGLKGPHVLFQRPCASAKKRKQQPLTPSVP